VPEAPYLQTPLPAAELFPVTHSVLSTDALGRYIQTRYSIGEVRTCTLLHHNLNDTYLVDAASGRYILRASQAKRPNGLSWRTHDDVLFELEVLRHLARKGIPSQHL
jgi:Ser/Thr protein kinase RdoA (MazF antagonist)